MVRAPCCEKMGLKKGPWTSEEDQILINYVNQNGYGNWRALPKRAGLLRCGKSCRLRWMNYLRPDIKRGNLSKEEEETIIKLHAILGNRWSAIASRFEGRTDNEIKNVWHTHLKKRVPNQATPETKPQPVEAANYDHHIEKKANPLNYPNQTITQSLDHSYQRASPQYSSSAISTFASTSTCMKIEASDNFPEVDKNFWSEVLPSTENSSLASDLPAISSDHLQLVHFPSSPLHAMEHMYYGYNSIMHDAMDFWFNVYTRAGEFSDF